MTNKETKEGWEETFDTDFKGIIVGILSDPNDPKSHVFMNNDLELARLKNFIRSALHQAEQRVVHEIIYLLDKRGHEVALHTTLEESEKYFTPKRFLKHKNET